MPKTYEYHLLHLYEYRCMLGMVMVHRYFSRERLFKFFLPSGHFIKFCGSVVARLKKWPGPEVILLWQKCYSKEREIKYGVYSRYVKFILPTYYVRLIFVKYFLTLLSFFFPSGPCKVSVIKFLFHATICISCFLLVKRF